MNWNNGAKTFENLTREGRRIRECISENGLSILESDAYALAIYEIGQAVALAQEYPMGHGFSLSKECIELFRKAARMAESERRDARQYGSYLVPISGESEVIAFPHSTT
ncbi:hypothetical protein [Ponticoccus alexandrii]|uniref:HEPN domain-containing protein n=1 Tax=Ponticoccus alexandrii TaxID=1943633 RepID=A0ABX7F757_9RHOB|nr:hypothetical protein [Ponticoccus alexandrii]QRF66351.1 hypothetical protein GQA70_08540 [Ponticoccus alexandrii]